MMAFLHEYTGSPMDICLARLCRLMLRMGLFAQVFIFASAFASMKPPSLPQETLEPLSSHSGRLLFLAQQGEHTRALQLYQSAFNESGRHDFEVLHQIALSLLHHGFQQRDPECQLLALFGAGISAHEEAYSILEEGAKSSYPEIQLVALQALAHFQNDRADHALLKAMGASSLQIKYEALRHLCKKKHPQAAHRAESLMYKTPSELWALYPPLFAMIGDLHSTKVLCKLLVHPSSKVRLSVFLSIAKHHRDDLLPKLRQQLPHLSFAEQEACVYALGCLKDELALSKLETLTRSPYPMVALAAHRTLYQLGKRESLTAIEKAAQEGNIFAIAVLGSLAETSTLLLTLATHSDLQIRFNASLALLEEAHSNAWDGIGEFLIRDNRDLAFVPCSSPGGTLKAWKAVASGYRLFEGDPEGWHHHLELKETMLEKARLLDASRFVSIAHQIFLKQEDELIPKTADLLEEMGSVEAIECLKEHQQQPGAPLVRHCCTLALYRLQEPGPYGDQLYEWVKRQSQIELIRFQPFDVKQWGGDTYTLTPEQTSKLLISSLEAFASNPDAQGIETLIEVIATGHAKNKYALTGLLLRATQ